jgi:hypothetical protein
VSDISRLFQAFLAPALFVSATALLILSINVRLMGIVSRLRQYVHAKHDAAQNGRVADSDAYTSQIESIEQRAELIRRCFLLALLSLAGTIASCLLLGFGLYFQQAALLAVIVFVMAMIALLGAAGHYLREVNVALSSVREEARDSRFMDIAVTANLRAGHRVSFSAFQQVRRIQKFDGQTCSPTKPGTGRRELLGSLRSRRLNVREIKCPFLLRALE